MRVRDLMSTNVVAVSGDTSIYDARKIMAAHKIRRLPVMNKDKLVGFLTKHMLLEATPSTATAVSMHELHYLLAKMTVTDVMVRNPYTVSPDMPAEEVMKLGQEMGYGSFPVVEDGRLVGIVTESDIVRLMTKALGVRGKGTRIDIKSARQFGNMRKIIEVLDRHKAILVSLLTFPKPEDEEYLIILRIKIDNARPVADDLKASGFNVTYVG